MNPTLLALSAANPGLLPLALMGSDSYGGGVGGRVIDLSLELTGWRGFLFNTMLFISLIVFLVLAIALFIGIIVGCVLLSAYLPGWAIVLTACGGGVVFCLFCFAYYYLMFEW